MLMTTNRFTRACWSQKSGAKFPPILSAAVVQQFNSFAPRMVRRMLEVAAANAAKAGRTEILETDIKLLERSKSMGFVG